MLRTVINAQWYGWESVSMETSEVVVLKVRWVSVMARNNGSLSQSSTHHLHKTHMKTSMAIQRAAESNTKTGRKPNQKHHHRHHHRRHHQICDHLYTHIVIINMKSYVKMEMFSLSLFSPLNSLVSAFTLEDWKSMFTAGKRIWNLCATTSAFLCKRANHLYVDRGM